MMSYGVREGKAAMFCARTPILVGNAMGRGHYQPKGSLAQNALDR